MEQLKTNFTTAAWLIANDNVITFSEGRNGKLDFNFPDCKLIHSEISELKNNAEVQKYIKGVFELKKMIRGHKQKQFKNPDVGIFEEVIDNA